MNSSFYMDQLDVSKIVNPTLLQELFEKKELTLHYKKEPCTLLFEDSGQPPYRIRGLVPFIGHYLVVWTTEPSKRLKIITGMKEMPNKELSNRLTEVLNLEWQYQQIKPLLTEKELAYSDITYGKISFHYPFEIVPTAFYEIYELLDDTGKQVVAGLESQFRDSIAAKFRSLFEKRHPRIRIPYYEVVFDLPDVFERPNLFTIQFSNFSPEHVKLFQEMLNETKKEVYAYYWNLRHIKMDRDILIRLIHENKRELPFATQSQAITKLQRIITPFDE